MIARLQAAAVLSGAGWATGLALPIQTKEFVSQPALEMAFHWNTHVRLSLYEANIGIGPAFALIAFDT